MRETFFRAAAMVGIGLATVILLLVLRNWLRDPGPLEAVKAMPAEATVVAVQYFDASEAIVVVDGGGKRAVVHYVFRGYVPVVGDRVTITAGDRWDRHTLTRRP